MFDALFVMIGILCTIALLAIVVIATYLIFKGEDIHLTREELLAEDSDRRDVQHYTLP